MNCHLTFKDGPPGKEGPIGQNGEKGWVGKSGRPGKRVSRTWVKFFLQLPLGFGSFCTIPDFYFSALCRVELAEWGYQGPLGIRGRKDPRV